MSKSLLSLLLLLCFSLSTAQADSGSIYLSGIQGRLVATGLTNFRDVRLLVLINGGEEKRTVFCRSDGTFTVPKLPAGVHVLTVISVDWNFPQIKIDVSSKVDGNIRLWFVENWKPVSLPIVLRGVPSTRFEMRRPFSLWGIVKSPYGIMICLMIFAIVVFPMMKVDPEEYRQMQAAWSNTQQAETPSIKGAPPSRRKD